MPRSSAEPTSSASSQRGRHHPPGRRHPARAERRVGRRKAIHDTGIHRSDQRHSHRQAARRGSLSLPAQHAGYRDRRRALTPRGGTRSQQAQRQDRAGPGRDRSGFPAQCRPNRHRPGFCRPADREDRRGFARPRPRRHRRALAGRGVPALPRPRGNGRGSGRLAGRHRAAAGARRHRRPIARGQAVGLHGGEARETPRGPEGRG